MEAVMVGHTGRAHDDTACRLTQTVRRNGQVSTIDPLIVRRVTRVAFVLLLAAAAIVVVISHAYQPEHPTPAAWSSVTVAEGSSLWDVASANPVPGLSTRETMALIRETNGLRSSALMAGLVLRVPSTSDPHLAMAAR
ncbi:MAG TPA: LysM peptidoglycan-binding domain-containing protein [Actinobacteria bacterium]|nr:LysM peptidoglycan-binding domain-containing protein [Actinomycetota bacterium]